VRVVKRALIAVWLLGCSNGADTVEPPPPEEATIVLSAIELDLVLPGTTARVQGVGFFEHGSYSAHLVGDVGGVAVDRDLPVRFLDDAHLAVEFEPGLVAGVPDGQLNGTLEVVAQVDGLTGTASIAIQAPVRQRLEPSFELVASGVYPASPVQVIGAGFIAGSEGRTLVELRGTFTGDRPVEVTGEGVRPAGAWLRDEISFVLDPSWMGVEPGRLIGEMRVVNEGRGWFVEGEWAPVELDLLPPTIDALSTRSASRGEAIRIAGQGFVGGPSGGVSALRIQGVFESTDGQSAPFDAREFTPVWESGTELVFSFRVEYAFGCDSPDLGATPGRIDGTVTPLISYEGQSVEGSPVPLRFDILPTRQVVHLRFLPAFTDSLRLFGLRNVSGAVRERVLEVIRRDYAGINLEIRLNEPTDFLEYSIVEIGGPDPNGGQLFGLDNTPDLDHCNARLDDFLAGRNAESGGYGGIFVESFLQLSPSRGVNDNPLAHGAFDEIFEPVLDDPVGAGEYPGGSRDAEIARAIRTLGNLVGNTATHEIGHSLGLPRQPGCGQYHNAAGDQQIMDCGADRPFEERAELVEGAHATWTGENRAYLEEILPLR